MASCIAVNGGGWFFMPGGMRGVLDLEGFDARGT